MSENKQFPTSNSITAKQAYLRNNVAPDKYQDFAQFCEAIAGNVNIDQWTIEYVQELVDRFNRQETQKKQANLKQNHSFHLYQTGSAEQIKKVSHDLKKEQKNHDSHTHTLKVQKPKQRPSSPMPPKHKQEKSALEVLDSIFQNHTASNNQYQTKKYDKSFFESCNFWGVVPEQPPKIQNKHDTPNRPKGSTPTKSKGSTPSKPKGSPGKILENTLPVDAQNFQKLFQTGMQIPQSKVPPKVVYQSISVDQQTVKNQVAVKPKIQSIDPPKQHKKQLKKQQTKPAVTLVSVKDIKISKIPYEGQILIQKPFKTTVACFKSLQRDALSNKSLKITIQNHQIINRSFFSSDYVMYHLKIAPANIICKRNLQDFEKLRKNLERVYPGVRLPYLQKPGWLDSQISTENISRQKKYLQFFLEDIISHNELKNSRILEDFLTLKQHKQIKRKFQQYEKLKKITSIEQLCLLEGQVKVEISEDNRQYNEYLSSLINKIKNFWLSKQKILADIDQLYISLMNNYKHLSQLIDNIKMQIRQFNRRVKLNQIQCLEGAMDSLQKYSNQNISVNLNESCFLQTTMLPFVRYQKQNMNLLNQTIEIRDHLTRQYLKRKDQQKGNDNIEYLSEKLKQFKTDILQQSKSITVLKYQCGYINQLTASEGHHYYEKLSHKINQLISAVCQQKLAQLSKTKNTYTELIQS